MHQWSSELSVAHLSKAYEGWEDNGSPSHTQPAINDHTSNEGEDDIRPGVQRVQEVVVEHIHFHYLLDCLLQGSWYVKAVIAPCVNGVGISISDQL